MSHPDFSYLLVPQKKWKNLEKSWEISKNTGIFQFFWKPEKSQKKIWNEIFFFARNHFQVVFQGQVFFPQILLGVSLADLLIQRKKPINHERYRKKKLFALNSLKQILDFLYSPRVFPGVGLWGVHPPSTDRIFAVYPPPNYMHTRTHTHPHDTQNKFC